MTSEMTRQQEALGAIEFSPEGAVQIRTLGEAFCVARLLIGAGFAPKGTTAEGATVSIMEGRRLGLDPLAAVQGISALNGRPTLWGDAMVAVVKASGLVEDERVEWFPSRKEPQGVRYTVKRRGMPTPYVGEFSRAMAERAGLWGKSGPWTTNPDRMLLNRARAFALRDGFADVLKGLTSTEEARDAAASAVVTAEARPVPEAIEAPAPRRKRAPAAELLAPTPQGALPLDPGRAKVALHPQPGNGAEAAEEAAAVPDGVGADAQPSGTDFLD